MARREIDGREALRKMDSVIARARAAVSDAIEAAESLDRELAETRREQAETYHKLASIQIEEADTSPEAQALAEIDREVGALLTSHESYLDDLLSDLDKEAEKIEELETRRADAADGLDSAVTAYENKVAEVEAALEKDDAYIALIEATDEAEGIAERARAKLNTARDDMDEKGEPFRSDPLFMYLWSRRYRTPDYKAGALTRFLDGWVAGLCSYDKSYRNYERLVELPEWLEGHVAAMEGKEDEARADLEEFEAGALSHAGADTLQAEADGARARLDAIDADIASAETRHLDIAARHRSAERGESGPAHQARQKLADALKKLAFPDLRFLASQTVTPVDDGLVDRLVTLRKDEMAMELRLDQTDDAPTERREDLSSLEELRRAFKAGRLDSPYALFKTAALDEVFARILSGRIRARDAVRQLSRSMKRVKPRTDPRFGGSRRAGTLGLPDVAVGIGMEILKEMGRSGNRGSSPWNMGGSLPRGRRTSFPKPRIPSGGSRRRGGFKTGGGF